MKKITALMIAMVLVACNNAPNPQPNPTEFTGGTNYLSDVLVETGFTKDGAGKTISIAGAAYRKGVGVNGDSSLNLNTNGMCSSFSASVGLDSNTSKTSDHMKFEILGDGKSLFATQDLSLKNGAVFTGPINIGQYNQLIFKTNGAGTGDWANAKLTCKNVAVQIAATDTTAPELDSVVPWGQTVEVSTFISLDFLEPMQPSTVSITVNPPVQFKTPVFWNSDDSYARYTPTTLLQPNTVYTVGVKGKDLAGNDVTGTFKTWSFKTGALSGTGDDVSPEMDSVVPWGQSIATDSFISLDFTETMNTNSLVVTTDPPIEFVQPIFWNTGDNYARLTPTKPLLPGTMYMIRVSGKDLAGNNLLGGLYTWSFKTAGTTPTYTGFTTTLDYYLNYVKDAQNNKYVAWQKNISLANGNIGTRVYLTKFGSYGNLTWQTELVDAPDSGAFQDLRLVNNKIIVVTKELKESRDGTNLVKTHVLRRFVVNTTSGVVEEELLRDKTSLYDLVHIAPFGDLELIERKYMGGGEFFVEDKITLDAQLVIKSELPTDGLYVYGLDDSGGSYHLQSQDPTAYTFYKYENLRTPTWSTVVPNIALGLGYSGNMILESEFGNTMLTINYFDGHVVATKISKDGLILWKLDTSALPFQSNFVTPLAFGIRSCTVPTGETYIDGVTNPAGSFDQRRAFVLKLNASGQYSWLKQELGGQAVQTLKCLDDGGVQVTTLLGYTNAAVQQIAFTEYDKDGYQR